MIIGLTVIKNEEQIIELFCRHNLNLLDKIYIVDNCSTDCTVDIVKKLIEEGLPITLIEGFKDTCHNQEVAMTDTLKIIKETDNPDWVFLLDADEVINVVRDVRTFRAEMTKLDKSKVHNIQWQTYVPSIAMIDTDNFITGMSQRRSLDSERILQYKAIIPNSLIVDGNVVTSGNHHLKDAEDNLYEEKTIISAKLAHLPIRTKFNTIVKILLNSHTLSTKKNREPEEGQHWDIFAAYIRNKRYNLTQENLIYLASVYGSRHSIGKHQLVYDPIKTYDNVEVKYKERTNPLVYFDKYIGNLIKSME